jgi:hypothetical protein
MDYSQKDFIDTYEDLISIIQSSTTKWDPQATNESDPGLIIVKLLALLEDKFNYKFDMAQAQGYIDTVSDPQYAQDLFRMLGYVMKSARTSRGNIYITLKESNEAPIYIPRHTVVTNATKSINFFTLKDIDIPANTVITSSKEVPVAYGSPFQISKDGITDFTLKDIDEDGRLPLGQTNLPQNGVFIYTVGTSGGAEVLYDEWKYYDLAITTTKNTKYYTISTLESNETYIQFPKDFDTLIGTSKIRVFATYTEGVNSNIPERTLSRFEDEDLDKLFIVKQPKPFENGQDSETITEARINYYKQKDICDTIITANDIKSFILSLADDTSILFSNALVLSAQDRALKIRNYYKDKEYYDIIPPTDPSYQVNVVPLKNSNSYKESFQIYTDAGDNSLGNTITTKLQEASSLFTKVKTFDNTITATSDPINTRLLAVAEPKLKVRISGYTTEKATSLKQSIKNRLNSRYRANYIAPGEAIKEAEVKEIVKNTSSLIQDVSLEPLEPQIYLTYAGVDNTSVSTLATDKDEIKKDIINRSVLSGEVPLFKYSNRQNTKSKVLSLYSAFAEEDENITIPTPFAYKSPTEGDPTDPFYTSGQIANPHITVTQLMTPTNNTETVDSITYVKFQLSDNLLFQTRKKHCYRDKHVFSSGLRYTFYAPDKCILSSDTTITTTTTLAPFTLIKTGSKLKLPPGHTEVVLVQDENGDATFTLNDNTLQETTQDIRLLSGSLPLAGGSILKKDSNIFPTSVINGTTQSRFQTIVNSQYLLSTNEKMIITDSNGNYRAKLEEGDLVLFEGVLTDSKLPVHTNYITGWASNTYETHSTLLENINQKITQRSVASSTIDLTSYKYILSLNSDIESITISDTQTYMLDENEYFLYTTPSATEYVILGPGTLLKSGAQSSIELTNAKLTEHTNLQDFSLFQHINGATILADAYEISTYTGSHTQIWIAQNHADNAILNYSNSTEAYSINTNWATLRQGTASADKILIKKNVSGQLTTIDTIEGSLYEARLTGLLFSDASGIARIPEGMQLTFKIGNQTYPTPPPATDQLSVLSTSLPFRRVLSSPPGGSSGISLYPQNTAAKVALFKTKDFSNVQDIQVINLADSISIILLENISSTATIDIPLKEAPNLYTNLSITQPLTATGSPKITIKGNNDKKVYILSHNTPLENSLLSDYADKRVTLDISNMTSITITLSNLDAAKNTIITLSQLSYVTNFSDELQADTSLEIPQVITQLRSKLQDSTAPERYDWLAYPKETLVHPLKPASFFNKKHPYNKNTFYYLDTLERNITILPEE